MDLFRIYAPHNLGCELNANDKYGNKIPLIQRQKDALKINSFLCNWIAILSTPITNPKIQNIKDEVEIDVAKLRSFYVRDS